MSRVKVLLSWSEARRRGASTLISLEIEITPEPTPEEREAILKALAALPENGRPPRGEWWRQGLREAVGEAEGDEPDA